LFVARNNRTFLRYINVCSLKHEILTYLILSNNIDISKSNREFLLIKRAFKVFDLQKIVLEKNRNTSAKLLNQSKSILAFNNTKNKIYSKQDNRIK